MALITLDELRELFSKDGVKNRKIQCIKAIRCITGAGLKESKEFFENELYPTIIHGPQIPDAGSFVENEDDITLDSSELSPPAFLVGYAYKQLNKDTVLIVGVSNYNTFYETVYGFSPAGEIVHRYNRRDFGRVTGSSLNDPHPYNLEVPE